MWFCILECELEELAPKQAQTGVLFGLGIEMRNWELKQAQLNPSTCPWLALYRPWSKKQNQPSPPAPQTKPHILSSELFCLYL